MEKSKLLSIFNIEPGEERLVGLLLLLYALLGVGFNFVQTAAFTLFLSEYSSQALSYVYIINAVSVSLLTYLYLRLGQRIALSRLLIGILGFLLLLTAVYRAALSLADPRMAIFLLPVLFQFYVNLGNLAFWALVGRLFNVRQGKRLFGLVGAGQWIGIVITGFLMPVAVSALGLENLLFLAAAGLVGALLVGIALSRAYSGQLGSPAAAQRAAASRSGRKEGASVISLLRVRYIALICAMIAVWWITFLFLDNLFYNRAAARFPDTQQLGGFLGIYLAGLGILTLFSNFFITGRVLSRFGLRFALLLLPVLLLAGTAGLAVAGSLGAPILMLFWLTTGNKLLDMSLGFSVDKATQNLLYQPLPPAQRTQTSTLMEGVVQPVANGLAGIGLLALGALFGGGILPLIYTLVGLVLVWAGLALWLGREYLVMLARALNRRRLGVGEFYQPDASSVNILEAGLHNPHPGVVIYSAGLLESLDRETLAQALPGLLSHPAPEVRQDALERGERLGIAALLPEIRQQLARESSPRLRGAALRTLAVLGTGETYDEVCAYLDDPSPQVRQGVVVGLLRSGAMEHALAAGQKVVQMIASPEAEERRVAAQALGEAGLQRYDEPLVQLLRDSDPQVRRAALRAAGRLNSPRLWPLVMEGLADPSTRSAALCALVSGGEAVLPVIQVALTRPETDRGTRMGLAQICGRIAGPGCTALLESMITRPDVEFRTQVLRSLSRCGYTAQEKAVQIYDQVRDEITLAAWYLACSEDIGPGPATDILRRALQWSFDLALERIFLLLSFLYNSRSMLGALENLRSEALEKRAYALEIVDVLVPQSIKSLLFPLIEDRPVDQRLKRLGEILLLVRQSRESRLEEIIHAYDGRATPWTKACALYAAYKLSLAKLIPEKMSSTGGSPMLATIEKVIILKSVSIFSSTPDETLADIARVLEEVSVLPGEKIFEKGDNGDSLYIIAAGCVQVHDGDNLLNELGDGDVFGEMALLDPEPRMASVTAVEDSQLLRLDAEAFYELIQDRGEVARGIIQVLTRRLRARVQDINELRTQVKPQNPAVIVP